MEQNKMRGDKTLSQDIYDAVQMVLHNGGEDHPDNLVDYIISNFELAEVDLIVEILGNDDAVVVYNGLRNHIQAYVDSVTMERDLGAIH
jgi:hypothetical protein